MKFYQALGISFEESTIEYCLHDLAKKKKLYVKRSDVLPTHFKMILLAKKEERKSS